MNTPFTTEQIEKLNKTLDPKRVKHRKGGGGMELAYLKGHDVIDTANEIFGYGQWGYDLMAVELIHIPGENGEVAGSYYAARLKLSVADCVPITEEGVCPVGEGKNPRARIDAHDMARKGAITDALKRALRCFGDQFGNSLYDTDLVNGQPRVVVAPRPVARPGVPAVNAANLTEATPEPLQFNRSNNGNGTNPTVSTQTASVNGGDLASSRQKASISSLASRQGMNEAALNTDLKSRFGVSLDTLTDEFARQYIVLLQKQA